jgi:predicted Zn finger-like uncharacterized protein
MERPVPRACARYHANFFTAQNSWRRLFQKNAWERPKIPNGINLRVAALVSYNLIMVESFSCPHCEAVYKLVRVKTPPEPGDQPVACLHCGHVLAPRDNEFLLKYFLVGRPAGAPRKAQAR